MEEIPDMHKPRLSDTEHANAHKSEDHMIPLAEVLAKYGRDTLGRYNGQKFIKPGSKSLRLRPLYKKALLLGIFLGAVVCGTLLLMYVFLETNMLKY